MHRRREFPASVKREAWGRCKDPAGIPRCEECTAMLSAGNIHYDERSDGQFDHDNPDAMGGEPTLSNCRVRCTTCHKRKTGRDRKVIAKSNHARDSHRGIKKPTFGRPLPGTIASGIALHINKPPTWRDSGKELWRRR